MKVGFVLDDSLDKPDGVQQYVLTLGGWLTDRGHDVHYLVGQTGRRDIRNIHSLSRNIRVRFNRNSLSVPLGSRRATVKKLLKEQAFDILHIQVPYSPMLAGKIIKSAEATTGVVGTFHILPSSGFENRATRLLRVLLRSTLKRFDAMVSVSPAAAGFAHQSLNLKTPVIPNAVNLAAYKNVPNRAPSSRKFTIAFLGRLVERKGCQYLLKAIQQLKQTGELPNVRVLIGGSGPLERQLKLYVVQHNLTDTVHFKGFISESSKPAFLAGADIAVFPSTGGESFGIVLIEAMAAGAGVVVGGKNPGYQSVLEKRKDVLVPPADIKALSAALLRFHKDAALRVELHQWQQKLVKQYDIEVVGPKIEVLYRKAIAKRRPTSDNT